MNEDPFLNLRQQLELLDWPSVYLFKFIAPNDSQTIALLTSLFTDASDLSFHESKTGKYVSVSVKELMLDVDSIIEIYYKAAKMKGVIAL